MSGFGQQAVQAAIYQKLTGDTALMALAQGVYDFVPEYSGYPYLTIGEISWTDASGPASAAAECELTARTYSRASGRKEAAAIMERLHDLLHNGTLAPTGYTLAFMRFVSGENLLQDDGITYQGVMKFQAYLQAS